MEEQETTFVPADEEPIQEPEEALTPEAETPEEAAEPETPETPDTEPEAPAESETEPEAPAESEAEPEAPEAEPETERPEEPAIPPEPVTPAEAEAELEQAESEIEQAEAADQPDTPPEPPLVTVVDIHFRNNVKTYFFDPGELVIPAGGHVVIDTARGDEFGFCATGNHQVRASEIVQLCLEDGRSMAGAIIFNEFKGTGRLINVDDEISFDFNVDQVVDVKL